MIYGAIAVGIVSKYSYTPIAIQIDFRARDGQEYPVISVPAGVTTPAVTKSQIGKIQVDEVYVRSLTSNNTVSSSKPTRRDWERLMRICLDNREADIGAFFRRHLGVSVDIDKLRQSFSLPESLEQQAIGLLNAGRDRFKALNGSDSLPEVGYVEIGMVIEGKPGQEFRADQSFLLRMQQQRPDYSGWPPFVYIYNPKFEYWNPFVYQGGWEANIISGPMGMGVSTIDFWRIDPAGRFYTIRALQDDMVSEGVPPLTYFDPVLHISRIAEAIATGLAFAESMEYDLSKTQIAFAFRWSHLKGRVIYRWAKRDRFTRGNYKCAEDEAVEAVMVPADVSKSAIWQYVEKISAGLLLRFGGYEELNARGVEEIVSNTLTGRI